VRILGVQDGINASACLLEDGVLTHAFQEERFTGVKEQTGFPFRSVFNIYQQAGIGPDDVDEMALATKYYTVLPGVEGHTKGMSIQQKLKDLAPALFGVYEDNIPVLKKKAPELFSFFEKQRNIRRLAAIREKTGYYGRISVIDHHLSHAASGYYSSPWRDRVLVLTKDASGDGLCATVNVGDGGTFRRIAQTVHTHSLGYLYTAVTGFMGMKQHSHEWKIGGLAPYAPHRLSVRPYEVFRSYIGVEGLQFHRKVPEPLHHVKPRLKDDLFMQRFDGIAAGLQRLTEELMVQWVRTAIIRTGLHRVTAAGGVFMNVKANKLIREMPEVEGFFPMPSAGDESTSIGAAQWLYAQRRLEAGQEVDIAPLGPLYLGNDITDREVELQPLSPNIELKHFVDIEKEVANLILQGEIVARCKGRMEFGARALMNRSILSESTNIEAVRRINTAIKRRDFWLPFAPTVLEHRTRDLLVDPVYSPYMNEAFDTTPTGRICLAAAVHQADMTARPQVLRESWNPDAHKILGIYENETGLGGLLNTSFNRTGNPIVCGPKEAIWTLENTGLRYLALGNYLLVKRRDR
jgi:carbamoyltransferase